METTPKLLPLWHSVTLRDTAEKSRSLTPMHIYPDHGGAGIDVFYKDGDFRCEELKSSVNKVNFKADVCALPFLPPNKLDSLFEPCMEKLLKDKEKEHEFFYKALGIHSAVKRFPPIRDCLMKISKKAPKRAKKGDYDRIKAPISLVELAKSFPKHLPTPRARWLYTGGCLATLESSVDAGNVLLHPVGRKLDSVAVTPLKENDGDSFRIHADLESQRKIAVPGGGGRIFQISTPTAPLSSPADFCCVRQRKMYHYIWLKSLDEEVNSYPKESYSFDEQLSDVKLSNYIPGEHVVVTVKGKLLLQDAERKKTVWESTEYLSHDLMVSDSWWGCDFGAHPRSILYTDRYQFTSLDLRNKNTECLKILSLPNPFIQEGNEQILMSRRLDVNDFQHIIATDFHMFIFDERYPQQPMISWNHMLESVPLYCDVKRYRYNTNDTELVALLGSQNSQDVASFHMSCSLSRIQPMSLSHPCHVSSPRDAIRNLELQCVSVQDDVLKRTSAPLIGVSVVPYFTGTGYSVFQLTSFGDVFHQEFSLQSGSNSGEEKTFRVEPGCALVPAAKIQACMSLWLEEAVISKEKKTESSSKDGVLYMFADREKMESDVLSTKYAKSCVICDLSSKGYECDGENSQNDDEIDAVNCKMCPRCGLSIEYGEQLLETYKNFGVLAGPFPSCLDDSEEDDEVSSKELQLIDFDAITDPLAKMVLNEWPERKQKEQQETAEPQSGDLTASFTASQNESLLLPPSSQVTPQQSSQVNLTPSSFSDFVQTQSSTLLDESFNASQELFTSQIPASPVPVKNKLKRIKLSSSFGF